MENTTNDREIRIKKEDIPQLIQKGDKLYLEKIDLAKYESISQKSDFDTTIDEKARKKLAKRIQKEEYAEIKQREKERANIVKIEKVNTLYGEVEKVWYISECDVCDRNEIPVYEIYSGDQYFRLCEDCEKELFKKPFDPILISQRRKAKERESMRQQRISKKSSIFGDGLDYINTEKVELLIKEKMQSLESEAKFLEQWVSLFDDTAKIFKTEEERIANFNKISEDLSGLETTKIGDIEIRVPTIQGTARKVVKKAPLIDTEKLINIINQMIKKYDSEIQKRWQIAKNSLIALNFDNLKDQEKLLSIVELSEYWSYLIYLRQCYNDILKMLLPYRPSPFAKFSIDLIEDELLNLDFEIYKKNLALKFLSNLYEYKKSNDSNVSKLNKSAQYEKQTKFISNENEIVKIGDWVYTYHADQLSLIVAIIRDPKENKISILTLTDEYGNYFEYEIRNLDAIRGVETDLKYCEAQNEKIPSEIKESMKKAIALFEKGKRITEIIRQIGWKPIYYSF